MFGTVPAGNRTNRLTSLRLLSGKEQMHMAIHSHNFVESYNGLIGFGADRPTDENTIIYYLQKFSDDHLMQILIKRLTDDELSEIFSLVTHLLKKHLTSAEYHRFFLKEMG